MRLFALALVATLVGCFPEQDDIVAFDERFEDCIECRWSTWYGGYSIVSTVHPAEHGLQLAVSTAISTPLAIEMYDEFYDGHWIEYSTDCGGTPGVYVQNTGSGLGNEWSVSVQLPTTPDGTPGEFERVYANLPPITDPDPYDWAGPRLVTLTLFAEPAGGACVIDNLRIMRSAPDDGW